MKKILERKREVPTFHLKIPKLDGVLSRPIVYDWFWGGGQSRSREETNKKFFIARGTKELHRRAIDEADTTNLYVGGRVASSASASEPSLRDVIELSVIAEHLGFDVNKFVLEASQLLVVAELIAGADNPADFLLNPTIGEIKLLEANAKFAISFAKKLAKQKKFRQL